MDKWLRSNTFVKIMSVALAVLLYIAVNDSPLGFESNSQNTSTVIRNVVLDAQLIEDRFAVVDMPQTINLTLRGNSFLLNRVAAGNYRAYVDLAPLGAGIHRNVPVKVEGLPEGIDYITDPSHVRVVVEEKQQKEMEIQVETVGQPKEGYTPGTPAVSPEKVLIRASENRLKDVALVKAIVTISGETETVQQSVQVRAYNDEGEIMDDIEIDEETVDVEVPITSPSKEIPIRSRIKALPPNGYSVKNVHLDPAQVNVFGEKEVLDGLDVYLGPELDLSDVTKDRTFEREIPLVNGVSGVEPESIEIEVEIVTSDSKDLKDLPIEVRGLPDGWSVDFSHADDAEVTATVEGAPDWMKQATRSNVRPYIDVSNLDTGTHKVDIQWDHPQYIKIVKSNKSVEVKLQSDS